ncbi:MAG: hypothetical protein ABIP74_01530 [Candidatus Saccharimonas sp.]
MKLSAKKPFPKKTLIASSAAVLLLVAVALIYAYVFHGNLFGRQSTESTPTTSTSKIDYGPATPEQQQAGTTVKTGSSDTPAAPTSTPGSTLKDVQVTITAANQNGSVLQIRVLIGAVENTGTCTLVLSREGQPSVTKTAGTQALSSSSTCQGFDVPTSELSAGTWGVLITYTSSTLTGSATKNIAIQ